MAGLSTPGEELPRPVSLYQVPELSDGVVTLRAATGDHVEDLYALLRDRDTLVLTGSTDSTARAERIVRGEEQPFGSPAKLEEVYEGWAADEDRAVWVIMTEGRVVGELLLMDLDATNRSCALRLWITGARDRGVGTAALTLALDHGFRTVGLHRVTLEVFEHNPRAQHVYEKLGFRREGTLREALWQDGRWVDAHLMGLLSREWLGEED